jgi:hypothetical protein
VIGYYLELGIWGLGFEISNFRFEMGGLLKKEWVIIQLKERKRSVGQFPAEEIREKARALFDKEGSERCETHLSSGRG